MANLNWATIKLLVVEDDEIMREILTESLESTKACVYSADNGQTALNVLKDKSVDLVISDVQMPVMNGVDLLKEIRKRDPKVPIVLFATGQSQLDEKSAVAQGAAGLFLKPFRIQELIKKIENLLTEKS